MRCPYIHIHLFTTFDKGLCPVWVPAEQHWNLARIVEHKKRIKKFHMHNFVKWVPWVLQLFKVRYYNVGLILFDFSNHLISGICPILTKIKSFLDPKWIATNDYINRWRGNRGTQSMKQKVLIGLTMRLRFNIFNCNVSISCFSTFSFIMAPTDMTYTFKC